jgi:hypothetical protein
VSGRQIENGKFSVTNGASVPCPEQSWDATNHQRRPGYRSYAIFATSLRDINSNPLNDIGRTITFSPRLISPEVFVGLLALGFGFVVLIFVIDIIFRFRNPKRTPASKNTK